jgi:AAA+ ATPase superfamily predicted ATPase
MKIIGRKREQAALREYYESKSPELLVVYGRRRVGKTFLIREYFEGRFTFYATGLASAKKRSNSKPSAWQSNSILVMSTEWRTVGLMLLRS